ncbi:MAG: hypothetical protein ACEY3F_08945 [Wolbachia sp.]
MVYSGVQILDNNRNTTYKKLWLKSLLTYEAEMSRLKENLQEKLEAKEMDDLRKSAGI